MGQTTLIILLVLAVVFAFAYFNYAYKHTFRYNPDDLKKSVDNIFNKTNENDVDRIFFLKELRRAFNCSRKDAAYLLGQASIHNMLNINEDKITKTV
jgi:hypothetical protein